MKPQDRDVGMPAWKYRPQDNDIAEQSITLTGAGTHRILYPLENEGGNWPEEKISRLDYCYSGLD